MIIPRKVLVLIAVSVLGACAQSGDKEEKLSKNSSSSSMFELPQTVDPERAAKLNIELGLGYLKQQQISRAKSKFLRAKDLSPHLPEVHYSYAYLLETVGETQEAEKSYLKAISIAPKNGNAHHAYGAFLCRHEKYKQSEKEFLKAVDDQHFNNTAESYENAGLCILPTLDVAKAVDYFEKALRYDPNRANALLELAVIRFQEGKVAQAKEYHHRFTQLAKPTSRSTLLGIELARLSGDRDKEESLKMLLKAQFPNAKLADLFTRINRS